MLEVYIAITLIAWVLGTLLGIAVSHDIKKKYTIKKQPINIAKLLLSYLILALPLLNFLFAIAFVTAFLLYDKFLEENIESRLNRDLIIKKDV